MQGGAVVPLLSRGEVVEMREGNQHAMREGHQHAIREGRQHAIDRVPARTHRG
jgi:hypothetical protein